jgi:hypothetical protein
MPVPYVDERRRVMSAHFVPTFTISQINESINKGMNEREWTTAQGGVAAD